MKTLWKLTHMHKNLFGSIDLSLLANCTWIDVTIPSAVQTSEFGFPLHELYQKDNIQCIQWMREHYWIYRTCFKGFEINSDEEAVFRFLGIDYSYVVFLNGQMIVEKEGMFSAVEVPLLGSMDVGSQLLEDNEIIVVVKPFEKQHAVPEYLKARMTVGEGWDFAPKILSMGIWDEAFLEVRKKLRVKDVWVKTMLSNLQRADITLFIELSEHVTFGQITIELGEIKHAFPVIDSSRLALQVHVPNPTLWWPNGMGDPNLVELKIELDIPERSTVSYVQKVGLRSIERIPCKGQGMEDMPMQLLINCKKTFVKGVNWVPLDSCIGDMNKERYTKFLYEFKLAGVNFIRVWGGGLKEKTCFYELADSLGFMVMQEFPLACQNLSQSAAFLKLLSSEVSAIIKTLRHHPSIVIWCGGNEHYHYWDSVDSGTERMNEIKEEVIKAFSIDKDSRDWKAGADKYDEPALTHIGGLCELLDGTRPYQITSAMEGEGETHGIWNWRPTIGDYRYRDFESFYDYWLSTKSHYFSECSVSSIANLDTIKYVTGESNPAAPFPNDYIWQLHNAFYAAWGSKDLWLDIPSTEKLFGKIDDIEEMVIANQWIQGEGARFMIEEIHRRIGTTSGLVWWGVNEPWPSLAGNCLIDYFGRMKWGWHFLKNAFKPVLLSLRYDNCVIRRLKPELWISSELQWDFQGRFEVKAINLSTGKEDIYRGNVNCETYSSSYVRTLLPIRMHKKTGIHIKCKLYDLQGVLVHTNEYLFGSIEDDAPFEGDLFELIKKLHRQSMDG